MRLSDLQNKDVVDISSGDKVGNVIDAEISNQGTIMKIIINDKKGFFNLMKSEEVSIPWTMIRKIGSDVILVSRNL